MQVSDQLARIKDICLNFKSSISHSNSEAHMLIERLLREIDDGAKANSKSSSPLTNREKEILTLAAKGFTNKEMASAFSLSVKTIEFHLKNCYQKCEASGRSEAISIAISNTWIKA